MIFPHEAVLEYAQSIVKHGFPCSMLGIDAKWQDEFGSTRFDPAKFPHPSETVTALHDLGVDVTLWTMPFSIGVRSITMQPGLMLSKGVMVYLTSANGGRATASY